jgi:hypothetical protein
MKKLEVKKFAIDILKEGHEMGSPVQKKRFVKELINTYNDSRILTE